ncbi:methylenetetrahydrofolate reductase [NAD(P)H] [Janibacter melonis]|uniref:Methylenetetrahydrofolate reductase n=1 Tax=Janibacter melonis TaxID=262209 RepID=A0A5P8FMD8_9MICO|nr:methylenetetrahydrofolate reductase [NAD(P)H] [Janibacter melonis]MCB5990377.1 methylenetetrahydrofolate reductase [NAD(P)H] [Janibacter melonis]MCM3554764.1 methylenetetrahydrofolate reductase [NAD(P)H] [Janibacter melonis]QFQ30343.1 methylenetetrahydrofolate reductase [NAD(P)H] [Janibacter melonis]
MTSPSAPGGTIPQRLSSTRPSISFEFMPPKDDAGEAVLWEAIARLEPFAPDFVSVTYGAGGSSQDRTLRVTEQIGQRTSLTAMAHLTCVSQSVDDLREVLAGYAAAGIDHVLALRGDPPGDPGGEWTAHPQGLDHAEDLVALVREVGGFEVGVAAFPDVHPSSASLRDDVETLVRKADAGASFAVTQMVFDAESYLRLRDEVAARRDLPITPGLMPVTSVKQIRRMAQLMGTPLPAAVVDRLQAVDGDPAAVRAVGVEIATELADRMLGEGAPGLHLITMNRSTASLEVLQNLSHLRA